MRSEREEPRRTGTATLLATAASPPRENERIVRPGANHHHLPPGHTENQPLAVSASFTAREVRSRNPLSKPQWCKEDREHARRNGRRKMEALGCTVFCDCVEWTWILRESEIPFSLRCAPDLPN
ncbi:hypothetical protein DMN91_003111 [Ooceraea biroi]|uniref:Uncharacterized protein n=1 Tax=Ooceraea biroi TaxID=2015173 RepID=A0A3L8DYJ0_OOCBI|nr:hypothetical protein DMN91_003111 [Ooceraea biroi]